MVPFFHEVAGIHSWQILFVRQGSSQSHYGGTTNFLELMQSCQRWGVELTLELEA